MIFVPRFSAAYSKSGNSSSEIKSEAKKSALTKKIPTFAESKALFISLNQFCPGSMSVSSHL